MTLVPELLGFKNLPLSPLRELALRYGFFVLARRREWPVFVYKLCLCDGTVVNVQSGENRGFGEQFVVGGSVVREKVSEKWVGRVA
jgi:hypothetical protein